MKHKLDLSKKEVQEFYNFVCEWYDSSASLDFDFPIIYGKDDERFWDDEARIPLSLKMKFEELNK